MYHREEHVTHATAVGEPGRREGAGQCRHLWDGRTATQGFNLGPCSKPRAGGMFPCPGLIRAATQICLLQQRNSICLCCPLSSTSRHSADGHRHHHHHRACRHGRVSGHLAPNRVQLNQEGGHGAPASVALHAEIHSSGYRSRAAATQLCHPRPHLLNPMTQDRLSLCYCACAILIQRPFPVELHTHLPCGSTTVPCRGCRRVVSLHAPSRRLASVPAVPSLPLCTSRCMNTATRVECCKKACTMFWLSH